MFKAFVVGYILAPFILMVISAVHWWITEGPKDKYGWSRGARKRWREGSIKQFLQHGQATYLSDEDREAFFLKDPEKYGSLLGSEYERRLEEKRRSPTG